MEITENNVSNPEVNSSEKIRPKFSPDRKKIFIFLGLIFLIIFLALGSATIFLVKKPSTETSSSPTPTVEATPSAKRNLSAIATDEAFLKLEGDLNNLEKNIGNVDLTEPKLTLPILEMKISFEK